MKNFTLLIAMLGTLATGYGQFSRSFNYQVNTSYAQSNFVRGESNGDISAYTAYSDGGQIRIKHSSFHRDGTLFATSSAPFTSSVSSIIGIKISGVFENATERIVSLTTRSSSSGQHLIWVKFNLSSNAVLTVLEDTTTYRVGFVNAVQNNSEIVTYQTKPSGLYRVAVPWSLSSVSYELVNASVTNSINGNSDMVGADAGTILVNGSTETVYYTGGHTLVTFYQRTSSNNYSITATAEPAPYAAEMVRTSAGNYMVLSKTHRQLYSPTFTLIDSKSNSAPSTTAKTCAVNGQVAIFDYVFSSHTGTIKHVDESLNLIDSVNLGNFGIVGDILLVNGVETSFGVIGGSVSLGYAYNYDGTGSNVNPTFIFHGRPVDMHAIEEFRHQFDYNDLHANLGIGQQVFKPQSDYTAGLQFHNGPSVAYTAKDGVAGITSGGVPLGYISNYFYSSEELPGPWTNQADYTEVIDARYNRGFYVTKQMIEAHIDSLQAGSSGYIAPREIADWPAHGNTSIGQVSDLAPFVDVNSNGTYEPYQGDYPKIYGDRCFFSITHSNPAIPENAGIETHSFVYTADCDASTDFSNVLLRKVFYYPRTTDSDSLAIMPFMDGDIGTPFDDFAGTDVGLGSIYTYQGDGFDEDQNGRPGFHTTTAAFAQMQLKGAEAPEDDIDNSPGVNLNSVPNGLGYGDGIVDNEYFTLRASFIDNSSEAAMLLATNPGSGAGLINPAHDLNNLGDHPVYSSTSILSRIDYPGDTDTLNYGTYGIAPPFSDWTEYQPAGPGSTTNTPGDRRTLITTGISKALLNQPIQMDQAYIFVADSSGTFYNTPGGIPVVLHDKCLAVRNAYQHGTGACASVFDPIEEDLKVPTLPELNLQVYPNPTTGLVTISGLPASSQLSIFDLNGRQVWSGAGNSGVVQFSVAELAGSVFVLKVMTQEGIYQARIVKK